MRKKAGRSTSSAGSSSTRVIASEHDVAASSAQLIDAFCDQLWLADGLAPASLASYRRDLVAWSAWLGKRGLLAADRGDVEGWLADQFRAKAKATSIARRLSTLRRFYRLQLERATVRED